MLEEQVLVRAGNRGVRSARRQVLPRYRLGPACEIHGIPHMYVPQWDGDLLRANEVSIAGPRLLAFSSYAVRRQSDIVLAQLNRMLRRGGWSG